MERFRCIVVIFQTNILRIVGFYVRHLAIVLRFSPIMSIFAVERSSAEYGGLHMFN
jgi:uncharacterized membrane protein